MDGKTAWKTWQVLLVGALCLVLGGAIGSIVFRTRRGPSSAEDTRASPVTVAPVTTTTTSNNAGNAAYARALVDIRARYMGQNFTDRSLLMASEALSQLKPPPGFEVRHRALIDQVIKAAGSAHYGSPVQSGGDEGDAEGSLIKLAHEADPTNPGY